MAGGRHLGRGAGGRRPRPDDEGRRRQQAYARIKNILIPNMYYRDDIGDRWFEDHDRLHTWGYLRRT